MRLWYLRPDTPRLPARVSAGESAAVLIGSWPVQAGQHV